MLLSRDVRPAVRRAWPAPARWCAPGVREAPRVMVGPAELRAKEEEDRGAGARCRLA